MKLSILTATYNRGILLKRLYESILNNLYDKLDIEWLIMDDGSSDDTEDIVKHFKNKNNLEIKYFKQENQGKMEAINNLIKYVSGELVMDCDSDDFFINNAFKVIYDRKNILLQDNSLYGLIFLRNENKGKLSGTIFEKENIKTTMFDMYFKFGVTGEKTIVFRSDIRKKYKHELEDGEKFITEARMYHKMDLTYGVKCFNNVIIGGEYLENGYTNNINKTFIEYPKGYFEYFKEILGMNMKNAIFKKRLYAIKHYILFGYLTKEKKQIKNLKGVLNKVLYVLLVIPGKIKTKLIFQK